MNIKEQLFKDNIKRINIESYNLCNRRCIYCPQSLNVRDGDLKYLNQEIYERLLIDLQKIDYENQFAFGRYHEPLLNKDITYNNIKLARNMLSNSFIYLNTNGDYVDSETLCNLEQHGLNEIKIMRYLNDEYDDRIAYHLCETFIERLGLVVNRENIKNNEICYFELNPIEKMKISIRCENYASSRGCNRGGSIKGIGTRRKMRCVSPIYEINIDYSGDVMPCCNMVSDVPMHRNYIMGNINELSIFDIYYSCYFSSFTKNVSSAYFKDYQTCLNCNYNE